LKPLNKLQQVHERSIDGDFLLLELKDLLRTHPKLKVILMSATINHETFVKYFNDAPLMTIPGFAHPVTDMYVASYSYQGAEPNGIDTPADISKTY